MCECNIIILICQNLGLVRPIQQKIKLPLPKSNKSFEVKFMITISKYPELTSL